MESPRPSLMRPLTDDELLLVSGGYSSETEPLCVYPLPPTPDWNDWYFFGGMSYDFGDDIYGGGGGGGYISPPAEDEVAPLPPPPPPAGTTTEPENYQYGGEGWDPATIMVAIP